MPDPLYPLLEEHVMNARRVALLAVALAVAAAGAGADAPKEKKPFATVDKVPILSTEAAADLEAKVRKLHTKLAPTVVRLWGHGKDGKAFSADGLPQGGGGSGVIIRKDGLILTCAHHNQKPGTAI